MNRTRLLLIGVVALALGALVSFAVYRSLQSHGAANNQPGVDVVVAANDIPVGKKMDENDIKVIRFNADTLPPNFIRDRTKVVGRVPCFPWRAANPFCPNKLAGENAWGGAARNDSSRNARRFSSRERCGRGSRFC